MQLIINSVAEARERLPELLARVAAGDTVLISDDGEIVATLSGPSLPEIDVSVKRMRAKEAVKAMVQHWVREGFELPPESSLRELLDEKS